MKSNMRSVFFLLGEIGGTSSIVLNKQIKYAADSSGEDFAVKLIKHKL